MQCERQQENERTRSQSLLEAAQNHHRHRHYHHHHQHGNLINPPHTPQKTKPKIQGTRDFGEEQMLVREEAFGIIRRIFKLHGAKEIGACLRACVIVWF